MTEDEAKKKWCPFVNFARGPMSGTGSNRDGLFSSSPTCIASECMAWKWEHGLTDKSRESGYCGLAGKP